MSGVSRSLLQTEERGQSTLQIEDLFEPPRLVRDIYPGPTTSAPEHPMAVDGTFFFAARDEQHGVELWALELGAPPETGWRIYLPFLLRR